MAGVMDVTRWKDDVQASIAVRLRDGALDVTGFTIDGAGGQFMFTLRGPRGGYRASVQTDVEGAGRLARVCRLAADEVGDWDVGGWGQSRLSIRSGDRYHRIAYLGARGAEHHLTPSLEHLTDIAAAIRFVAHEIGVTWL